MTTMCSRSNVAVQVPFEDMALCMLNSALTGKYIHERVHMNVPLALRPGLKDAPKMLTMLLVNFMDKLVWPYVVGSGWLRRLLGIRQG